MSNGYVSKINKIGLIGQIVFTILKVLLIIALIGTIFASVVMALIPDDTFILTVNGEANIDVHVGFDYVDKADVASAVKKVNFKAFGTNFTVSGVKYDESDVYATVSAENMVFTPRSLVWPIIAGGMYVLGLLITVWFSGALCTSLKKCHSPFEENVIKKMRNFAFSLIPWIVLSSITGSVATSSFGGGFNVSINLGTVIIVLAVFALVFIFKYGANLQKESDETL